MQIYFCIRECVVWECWDFGRQRAKPAKLSFRERRGLQGQPRCTPPGEARPDFDIFLALAESQASAKSSTPSGSPPATPTRSGNASPPAACVVSKTLFDDPCWMTRRCELFLSIIVFRDETKEYKQALSVQMNLGVRYATRTRCSNPCGHPRRSEDPLYKACFDRFHSGTHAESRWGTWPCYLRRARSCQLLTRPVDSRMTSSVEIRYSVPSFPRRWFAA